MKTAVVTGATGFIGMALSKLLLKSGIKVYAIGRNKCNLDRLQNKGATTLCLKFEEYKKLPTLINKDEQIDVFYNCAFEGGFGGEVLKDYNLQISNAKNACDSVSYAISMKVKKFVYLSTVNAIEAIDVAEGNNCSPRYTCIYSASKIASEIIGKTLAHNEGMQFISALIAMPYGEYNFANTLPNIVMNKLINPVGGGAA